MGYWGLGWGRLAHRAPRRQLTQMRRAERAAVHVPDFKTQESRTTARHPVIRRQTGASAVVGKCPSSRLAAADDSIPALAANIPRALALAELARKRVSQVQ